MSRNLGQTSCYFCHGRVVMTEEPRVVTPDDVNGYYEERDGYGYVGMVAAHAQCEECEARYLAHVDMTNCPGYGRYEQLRKRVGVDFFDLSFRSTFNDEPGPDDMPRYRIVTTRTRVPWTE